ncbi:hypothetical protein MLD38_007219 [Melastoma candidum]|uniref:Uncharacterized protein n=1 Tax=Melastoma candidum TaxID=119954 RepID=A0ACB9RTE9_9MYRT|nr:hypothetical protein MLD38_007219 [Melastoma candidum]
MAVDSDRVVHKIIVAMLKKCQYQEAVPKKILQVFDEPGIRGKTLPAPSEIQKDAEEARACSRINMQPMKTSKVESCGSGRAARGLGPFVTGTGHIVNPFSFAYAASHPNYAQMPSHNSLNNQVPQSNWLHSSTKPSTNFPNLKLKAFSTSQLGPQNRSNNHLGSTPLLGITTPMVHVSPQWAIVTSTIDIIHCRRREMLFHQYQIWPWSPSH